MRVFFVRHGEATDDLEDRYGGWYDPGLTKSGIKSAQDVAKKVRLKKIVPDIVLTSPLRRAKETAQIISQTLKVPVQTFVYLKERNTYGLLSGENKTQAKRLYPELVQSYERGVELLGYEPYDFFLKRVKSLFSHLTDLSHKTVICVTHGKMLGAIFKDIIKKEAKDITQSCLIETEVSQRSNVRLISFEGVIF